MTKILISSVMCKKCRMPALTNADDLCEFCGRAVERQAEAGLFDEFDRRFYIGVLVVLGAICMMVYLGAK